MIYSPRLSDPRAIRCLRRAYRRKRTCGPDPYLAVAAIIALPALLFLLKMILAP